MRVPVSMIDVHQHIRYQVLNTPVRRFPFPHLYVENVFPAAWYSDLLRYLPKIEAYQPIGETGTVPMDAYPQRFVGAIEPLADAEGPGPTAQFWAEANRLLMAGELATLFLDAFAQAIEQQYGTGSQFEIVREVRLVRDLTDYRLPPHTDHVRKLVSALFYLPPDDSLREHGTSLYVPADPSMIIDSDRHLSAEAFKRVATMPFLPNSMFAFVRSGTSFHGVEAFARPRAQRDSIMYNLYTESVVTEQPGPPPETRPAAAHRAKRRGPLDWLTRR